MSRFQDLKDFLERRLLTAVSRDLGEERTTSGYEEELQRQRKLLQDGILIPEIKLHRADMLFNQEDIQLRVVKEEELPPEQQERSPYPDQEENEFPLIKEEEEEVWIAQGREQLQGLEEADTKFLFPSVHMKSENDEEKPQSSLLHQRLTEHMETAAGGEDCGRAEPARSSDPQRHLQAEIEVHTEAFPDTGSGSEDEEDDWEEPRDCPRRIKCGKTYSKEKRLTSHMIVHSSNNSFSCTECGKTFNKKNQLTSHMNVHLGEKPFSCPLCFKGFTRKADLVRHMLVHSKEKPFSCSVCGRRFGLKANMSKHMSFHLKNGGDQEIPKFSLLHQRLTEHMETAAGGEGYGGPEPARSSDPQRHLQTEIEVHTEASSDSGSGSEDEEDDWEETRDHPKGVKSATNQITESVQLHNFAEPQETGHLASMNEKKPLSCSVCGKTFNKKNQLTSHMNVHSAEKPFSCTLCCKGFTRKADLVRHMLVHSKEKPFSCSVCGRKFGLKANMTKHMSFHLKNEGDQEKPQSSLLHQRLTEHMETAAGGEDCGRAEPARSSDPQGHLQPNNKVQTEASSDTGSGSEDEADDRAETRDHLKGVKSSTNQITETVKLYTCAGPGDTSRVVSLIEQRPFSCAVCCKGFARKSDLGRHMLVHTKEQPFSCSECGKKFSLKSNLTKHMCLHLEEKPFNCSECGKGFGCKTDLGIHMMIHTKEKPFICSVCGKRFSRKANMAAHMSVHSEEKPFSCSECGKTFNQKRSLTSHMIVHSEEKPFSCSECGRGFKVKQYLSIHMLVHTQEKPFSCFVCGKRFNHKVSLTAHMIIHAKEKSFSCSECGKLFSYKSTLTRHMLVHSKENGLASQDGVNDIILEQLL